MGNTVLARPEIEAGRLVMPFEERVESRDAFYLVCEESQAELGKIAAFRDWILALVEPLLNSLVLTLNCMKPISP